MIQYYLLSKIHSSCYANSGYVLSKFQCFVVQKFSVCAVQISVFCGPKISVYVLSKFQCSVVQIFSYQLSKVQLASVEIQLSTISSKIQAAVPHPMVSLEQTCSNNLLHGVLIIHRYLNISDHENRARLDLREIL